MVPSAKHAKFTVATNDKDNDFDSAFPDPNQKRWMPFVIPTEPTDFVQGFGGVLLFTKNSCWYFLWSNRYTLPIIFFVLVLFLNIDSFRERSWQYLVISYSIAFWDFEKLDFWVWNRKVSHTIFIHFLLTKPSIQGWHTVCGAGDPKMRSGIGCHVFMCNKSMENKAMQSADGEMLIVAQEGTLYITTEMGK